MAGPPAAFVFQVLGRIAPRARVAYPTAILVADSTTKGVVPSTISIIIPMVVDGKLRSITYARRSWTSKSGRTSGSEKGKGGTNFFVARIDFILIVVTNLAGPPTAAINHSFEGISTWPRVAYPATVLVAASATAGIIPPTIIILIASIDDIKVIAALGCQNKRGSAKGNDCGKKKRDGNLKDLHRITAGT